MARTGHVIQQQLSQSGLQCFYTSSLTGVYAMVKKPSVELANKAALNFMQQDLDQESKRMESIQKLHYRYLQKRQEILGPELSRAMDVQRQSSPKSGSDSDIAVTNPLDRQYGKLELLRRYQQHGVNVEDLRSLDREFSSHLTMMRHPLTPHLPMSCEVTPSPGVDLVNPAHVERHVAPFRSSQFRIVEPAPFHPPYLGSATNEGMTLAHPEDLGNHSDATDAAVGRLGADLYVAHFADYTSNGENYNYARNTAINVSTIDLTEPSTVRVTVRLVCDLCDLNYRTEHTSFFDPRDSDSQIELVDQLFVGFRHPTTSTGLPDPSLLVAAGELAFLRAHEDDGFDSRLIRNRGDLLTMSAVFPHLLTTRDFSECPYVYVGIKHYAFFWAKNVKFDLRMFTRWNIVDVTVTNV